MQSWDVQRVPNKNPLAIQADDGRTTAQNRRVIRISHTYPKVSNPVIRDEGRAVRDHVIGGSRVGDNEVVRIGLRRDRVGGRLREELGQSRWETDGGHGRIALGAQRVKEADVSSLTRPQSRG